MTTATKPKSQVAIQVEEFTAACREAGFTWEAKDQGGTGGGIVTVLTSFTPGDRDAYVRADGIGPSLLRRAPIVDYGTTWGTDGASVGGHAGMTQGYYRLSRSGIGKRFVKALAKVRS